MSSYQQNRIFTLNEPNAPRLNPALAVEIGLNESLLLLQIEFYIAVSGIERDGKLWIFNSTRDIQSKWFPFWSHNTINRALNSLESSGYINTTTQYNTLKYDKTRWFSLNYQGLTKLKSIVVKGYDTRSSQFDTGSSQNGTGSNQFDTTIQENLKRDLKKQQLHEPDPPILPDKPKSPSLQSSGSKKITPPELSELYPNREIEIPALVEHDIKDLIQSIPAEKRSKAVEKVIEQALSSLSVDEVRAAIAYTLKRSTGGQIRFRNYLAKTLDLGYVKDFELETAEPVVNQAKAFLESRRQMPDSVLKYEAEVRGCKVCAQVLKERGVKI